MKYLLSRLQQPSTYIGLAAAAAALVASHGAINSDSIAPLLAAFGLVQVNA